MAGSHLLDTNTIVAYFAGEAATCERVDAAEEVLIPSVVVGELYFGAFRSGRPNANLARIAGLLSRSVVLVCDADTAREYGLVKDSLRRKGRPIPDNDIWIAAAARQHGLVLVTRDAHFAEIDDLACEAW